MADVSRAAGGPRGAPWNILVERDGEYEIALSRWPPFLALPLIAGRPLQKMTAGTLPEGKAMPIAGAKLVVAGQERMAKTGADDKAAVFRVRLARGPKIQLDGWFQDAEGNDLCGTFYAKVTRL